MFGHTFLQILPRFGALSLCEIARRNISRFSGPLCMKVTPYLYAEPLRKKKRIDPAIVRAREEKKKKRLEKQIRRLEKISKKLKPLEEMEVAWVLHDEKTSRERKLPPLSQEEEVDRLVLLDEWCEYKIGQHRANAFLIDKIMLSQQKALEELKNESEELYNEAVKIEANFLPFKVKGPVYTPPNPNYESPDGEYIDVSKKWD